MPLIFNDTNITNVLIDGIDINSIIYNNVEVFSKRTLTINFVGKYDAINGTYPLYISSPSIGVQSIYGASTTKTFYIPNGERVTIDMSRYKAYYNAYPPYGYGHEDVYEGSVCYAETLPNKQKTYSFANTLTFTMDRDITLGPIMDELDEDLGTYTSWLQHGERTSTDHGAIRDTYVILHARVMDGLPLTNVVTT